MLKDSEPYFKGDIVQVEDDRVEYLVDQKIAKVVDGDTPLFSKGVELTQDGVSIQDKEYGAEMAKTGAEGKKALAQEKADKEVEATSNRAGRPAGATKPGESAPTAKSAKKDEDK